jgi:cell division GTPase FtsZ
MPPQLEVLQLGASGAGAGGKPEVAREAAESRRDAIAAFLDTVDVVVIQCGLGGGTGTGATPTIVDMAKSMGKLPLVIATQPFKFEGKKRLDRAAAAREELLQQVPTITIYNDRLPNKKIMFDEAWKKVTECGLLPPLLALRKLLQVVGAHVNRDLADYGTALSAGNHVLSICAEDINPNDDVKSTIAKLMEGNPYQDMEILKTADYIIPTYEGPWGVGEVWEINQFITEQVRTLSDDFEMNYFIGDTKGPKSVGMLVVAKAPPAKATSSIPSFSSSAMDPAARSFFAQPVNPFEEPPALVRDSSENHNYPVRPKPGWID